MNISYKTKQKTYLSMFIFPLIYAFLISNIDFPEGFDICRYYNFYNIFKQPDKVSDSYFIIFKSTPDFLFYIYLYVFAFFSIKIEILLFIITYVTSFFILLAFNKFYVLYQKKQPSAWSYFLVFLFIPVVHILSGIRNIHAFSFILMSLYCFRINYKKMAFILILYASLFHYSCYIFFVLFLYDAKFLTKKIKIIIITCITFFSAFQWLLIKNILDFFKEQNLLSFAWSEKLFFYFSKHDNLINILNSSSPFLYFIFYFFENYWLLIYCLINRKIFDFDQLDDEIFLLVNCFLLFLFFSTINNRYVILLNFLLLFKILIQNDKFKKTFFLILLIPFMGHLIFWVGVFNEYYLIIKKIIIPS